MIEYGQTEERVILVAVSLDENGQEDATAEESLDELAELVKTAGAAEAGRVIQNREHIHPATYVGSGKIEEILDLAEELDANGVVCDDELSPAQIKNIEDAIEEDAPDGYEVRVIDRSMLILDIFALHASSAEGKLQVELAQLRYTIPRIIGKALSFKVFLICVNNF